MPLISVIIPVYNSEKYLPICMEKIINQTLTDFEVILIDDGSTDDSSTICDVYAKKDSRISVIHQKNSGQAVARNRGISISKGKWIVFIDSDDVVSVNYLQTLYNCVYKNSAQMAFCGIVQGNIFDESHFKENLDKQYINNICEDTLIYLINKDNFAYWTVWGKIILADIVKKNLFTDGYIYEDVAVVFKWINNCEKFVYIEDLMYFYRTNEDSTTRKNYSVKKLDRLWALNQHIEFYINKEMLKMTNIICSTYYFLAAESYKNLLKINEIDVARELKRKTKIHHSKYKKYIGLFGGSMNYYLEVFYPHLSRIYWTIKGIKSHIKINN